MQNEYIETFTGETIVYNDLYHTYHTIDGIKLKGGSSYAKQYSKRFPKKAIISKLTHSWDMPAKDIEQLWNINGSISNNYGTCIHDSMELWFRFYKKGKEIQELKGLEYNYALPKNVYLRNIVLDFVDTFGNLDGVPEATLSCIKKRMAGRTDLIVLTGEKTCRVADYKTNNDMPADKILSYQHQLSFYADMLTEAGWTVEGLDIYYHNGGSWEHIELDVLPVILETKTDELSTLAPRPPVFKGV